MLSAFLSYITGLYKESIIEINALLICYENIGLVTKATKILANML